MISTNLSAGLLITGNTRYLPVVTFAGAAVTAISCWWFIPLSGMDGAAYAIVAGTAVMCLVMAWFSLRVFPVRHDWLKLFLLLVAAIALASMQLTSGSELPRTEGAIALKGGLLLLYLVIAGALFHKETRLLVMKAGNRFTKTKP
ncbi:MAG: polysaccharide biosynthesis C-terminal domain-containing protein, partial [Chlorobium sp.]